MIETERKKKALAPGTLVEFIDKSNGEILLLALNFLSESSVRLEGVYVVVSDEPKWLTVIGKDLVRMNSTWRHFVRIFDT